MVDKRRYGVIEVRFRPGPPAIYSLSIGGEHWAAVEWSASRRTWCIEDAAGHCLAHCEHIHGDNIDRSTAIALAKKMIVDGRMPTPQEARAQLEAELKTKAAAAAEERRRTTAPRAPAKRAKPVQKAERKAPAKRKAKADQKVTTDAAETARLEAAAADGMRQLAMMRQRDAVPLPAESSTASRQSTKN